MLRSLVNHASAPAARVMHSRSGALGAAHHSGAIGAPARRRRPAPRLGDVTAPALGAQASIRRVTSQMPRGEPISLDIAKRPRAVRTLAASEAPRAAPRLAASDDAPRAAPRLRARCAASAPRLPRVTTPRGAASSLRAMTRELRQGSRGRGLTAPLASPRSTVHEFDDAVRAWSDDRRLIRFAHA